jgi:hypothetical protein
MANEVTKRPWRDDERPKGARGCPRRRGGRTHDLSLCRRPRGNRSAGQALADGEARQRENTYRNGNPLTEQAVVIAVAQEDFRLSARTDQSNSERSSMMKSTWKRMSVAVLLCLHVAGSAWAQAAPDLDADWGVADIEALNAYMGTLSEATYPQLGGADSDLFAKLIDSVEQGAFLDTTIPVDARIELCGRMQMALVGILMKYVSAFTSGGEFATELAHTMGCTLVGSRQLVALMEEALADADPNDAGAQTRAEGLAQARSGLGQQVGGVVMALADTQSLTSDDRLILAGYLRENVPAFFHQIELDVQGQIISGVRDLIAGEPDEAVRTMLEVFVADVTAEATEE